MNPRLRLTRILLVPAAFLAVATHHVYREDSLIDTLLGASGLTFLLLAAGGRIWASAYLGGRKNHTLVTEGPYSLVRNPLYLFSLIGFAGAGLAFGSLALAVVFVLTFFVTHWPAIHGEERELERLFGEDYVRYRARVPRFVPLIKQAESRRTVPLDTLRFSSALRDCLAIPMVLIVAEVLEWAKLNDLLPVLFHLP